MESNKFHKGIKKDCEGISYLKCRMLFFVVRFLCMWPGQTFVCIKIYVHKRANTSRTVESDYLPKRIFIGRTVILVEKWTHKLRRPLFHSIYFFACVEIKESVFLLALCTYKKEIKAMSACPSFYWASVEIRYVLT